MRLRVVGGTCLLVGGAVLIWFWSPTRGTAPDPVPSPQTATPAPKPEAQPTPQLTPEPIRTKLPAARPGELAGLVVDADSNRPLPEVEIEVANVVEKPLFAPGTTSDSGGAFALEAERWRDPCTLRFAHDGYRTLTLDYGGDGNVGRVALTKAAPLRLQVVDARDGSPVPATPVDIRPSTGSRLMWLATETTDADGRVTFVRSPDDGTRVRVRTTSGELSVVLPKALSPEPITIQVPSPREVRVTVIDAQTRAPLPRAGLQRPDGASLTCDDAGVCVVPVLNASTTVVRVDAPGYFAADTMIDARATALVIEARPTCTIRGRIDSSLQVVVERTAGTGPGFATRLPPGSIASDGNFVWTDVPAHSHLAVSCLVDGAVAASTSLRTPGAGETADLPPIRVAPLARVRVRVEGAQVGPVVLSLSVRDARRSQLASHRATISPLAEHALAVPAGQLRLAAMQRDGGSARTQLDVPPEADLAVTLRLEAAPDVAGTLRLVGASASPQCEIWCLPLDDGLPSRHAWTDAAGRFVLRSLPAGRYQVQARPTLLSPPGYAYESASRELGPGERALELTIPRLAGEIRGRVIGVPEGPSPQALVRAVDRDGRHHPGVLDPSLRFTIAVPAEGPFRVEALSMHVPGSRGQHWTATQEGVAAGADVALQAQLR